MGRRRRRRSARGWRRGRACGRSAPSRGRCTARRCGTGGARIPSSTWRCRPPRAARGWRGDDEARAAERALRPRPARGGRDSAYTPEAGEAVCARLEAGETLTAIGADPAMPSYAAVLGWARRFPEFADRYAAARAVQQGVLVDLARDVAAEATRETVPLSRLRFDVIRWEAARTAPKKYADQVDRVEFVVMRFEAGPDGRVLCAPPRNAREAQAWLDSTGRPYAPGVGPKGQVRPPRIDGPDEDGGDDDWGGARRLV